MFVCILRARQRTQNKQVQKDELRRSRNRYGAIAPTDLEGAGLEGAIGINLSDRTMSPGSFAALRMTGVERRVWLDGQGDASLRSA